MASYTSLHIHIVCSTKQRRPLLTPTIDAELYPYIGGIARNEKGSLLEAGGVADHVHLLVRLHQTTSVADIVRLIKANSSKWLNERSDLGEWPGWQNGYGAFTVSRSQLADLRDYVQNQEQRHRLTTFQDEFRRLLERHGIEYDERYLWE